MKKALLTLCSALLIVLIAQAANVRTFWTAPTPADSKLVKIYYGSQPNTYTNSKVFDLTILPTLTNAIPAYDTFACNVVTQGGQYLMISGLQYTQQYYWAYSYINTNGVEGPIVAHSVCGFTVTNRSDEVFPPEHLKTK